MNFDLDINGVLVQCVEPQQIALTFHLLLHLKGRFSRLTYRRFYYVIRLSFSGLLSVSCTCGLIIQFTYMLTCVLGYFYVYVFMCENKDDDDDDLDHST